MTTLCFLCFETTSDKNFMIIDQSSQEILEQIQHCLQLKLCFEGEKTKTQICKTCKEALYSSYKFCQRIKKIQLTDGEKIESMLKVKLLPFAASTGNNATNQMEIKLNNNNTNIKTRCKVLNSHINKREVPDSNIKTFDGIPQDEDNASLNDENTPKACEAEEDVEASNREETNNLTNVTSWKTYPYFCYLCIYSTFNFSSLVTHAMSKHQIENLNDMQYQCVDCKEICNNYALFLNHVREHHGNLKLCCDICSVFFEDYKQLAKHYLEHKDMLDFPQPFVHYCNSCSKVFEQKKRNLFNKHLLSHEDALECQFCEKSFKCLKYLKRHMEMHTESKFKCDFCEKTFTRHFNKISHERVHTGEKPYKCDLCNKSFSFQSTWKNHVRTHTGELPYKCDYCDDAFRHFDSLKEHTRIHTNETPYKCTVCDKDFRYRKSLNRHMREHTIRPAVKTNKLPLKKRPTKDLKSKETKKKHQK